MTPAQKGESIACDEVWAYVGSKKKQAWIWLSWSYLTKQTLSFAVGGRDGETGKKMFGAIPKDYKRKRVYTDQYNCYPNIIAGWRHQPRPKGSGSTNIAEGCNNYLRHRVSYLVRRSASFARSVEWFCRRLYFVLFTRNERIKQKTASQQTRLHYPSGWEQFIVRAHRPRSLPYFAYNRV